jgi:hypothetical protein
MIISHKYRFVFIHIPKNAGTFTTELLRKIDPDALNIRNTEGFGHQTYTEITKHPLFDKIKNYKFFAILRNPVDQLISWYNFTKKYDSINKNREFNEFIRDDKIFDTIKSSKFVLDNNNKIPNNVTLIDYDNLQAGLTPFFISLEIPKKVLYETRTFYNTNINESKHNIKKNNDLLYHPDFLNLLSNKDFVFELLFYNTTIKFNKQFNFNL